MDDIWQQIAPLFKRPGPKTKCSDSELNQLDEALDDASRAIELGQEERGYANRAVVEENRGETAKAASNWGQVIALKLKNGEAYVEKKLWKEMSSDWDAKVKQALKNL